MLATLIAINATGREQAYTIRRARAGRQQANELASLLEKRFPQILFRTNGTRVIRAFTEAAASPPLLVEMLELLIDERGWGRFAVGVAVVPVEWDPSADPTWWYSPEMHGALRACSRAQYLRVPVDFSGLGGARERAVSAVANVALWIRSRWSPATRALVEQAEEAETLRALARELGISPPTLSKRLRRAGWRPYRYARGQLVEMLQEGISARLRRRSLPAAFRGSASTKRTREGTL